MKKVIKPLVINTTELQQLLGGVCYRRALRIGEEAGAKVMLGKHPRWHVGKIEEYLESKLEKEGKSCL